MKFKSLLIFFPSKWVIAFALQSNRLRKKLNGKKRRLWEDWYFCFHHGIHKKKSSWKTANELKTESKEREKSRRKANILMDQLVALIPVEVQVDTGCGSPGYVPVQSRGKPRLSHYLLSNEIPPRSLSSPLSRFLIMHIFFKKNFILNLLFNIFIYYKNNFSKLCFAPFS